MHNFVDPVTLNFQVVPIDGVVMVLDNYYYGFYRKQLANSDSLAAIYTMQYLVPHCYGKGHGQSGVSVDASREFYWVSYCGNS